MLILTLILLLMMACLGWYFSRDVFAPYVISPVIWSLIIGFYYIVPNNLYPIHNQFPVALALWMTGFFVSSIAIQYFTKSSSVNVISQEPNVRVLYVYFWISVIIIPVISFLFLKQAFTEDPEAIFRYLRVMSTGSDDNIETPNIGPLAYFVSISYVSIFFVLLYIHKKKYVITIIILNILMAIVTMAKTNFLSVFFSTLYLGYIIGYVKKKHLLYGVIGFFLLSFGIQTVRQVGDDFTLTDMLILYLSTSMVAFDYFVIPGSSGSIGANTFRFLYAIGHSIGICDAPENTILDFVCTPENTNTYTVLYPFYKDFGLVGVLVFSIIYGCFYGFLYKKSSTGGKIYSIIYAVFLTFIVLNPIGEFIFTNFSLSIQYILLTILPFIHFKRNKNVYDK